ncbi:MAG TPA: ROK family transcriptional regulator [Trueperaceae bacterium]|nr:ROK family transcriptional regulator [Trueperaceae bacterium]
MRKPVGRAIGLANKQLVFNELRRLGRASADSLVRSTGLSLPTVQKWLAQLEKEGYARQSGLGASTGGRPPLMFEFDATRDYVLGLAVEIPNVSAALMDLSGKLHASTSRTIPTDLAPDATLALLYAMVDDLVGEQLPAGKRPAGMGVAFSGFLDFQAGLSLATPRMPQWTDVPVKARFEERYAMPVALTGHIDALTVAEMTVGVAAGGTDFLFFDVGWGVGTRVVHDGNLVVSTFGNSGLIGHTTVVPHGRACLCGNQGCLEEYASGRALLRIAGELGASERADAASVPELAAMLLGDGAAELQQRPPLAEFLDFLVLGISNAINIFDLPEVVLGGYLAAAGSRVRTLLGAEVPRRLQPTLRSHLHLMFSSVPRSVGSAYGAAVTALRHAFPDIAPVAVQPEPLATGSGREAG